MKHVASLRYGVVFKKAFCDPEIFVAFIRDMLGMVLEIEQVETEKEFDPPIGYVIPRFDLFAEGLMKASWLLQRLYCKRILPLIL